MSSFVLGFQDVDKTKLALVGGKGANLGELSRIAGVLVPEGFCITTEAFKRVIDASSSLHEKLDQLAQLKLEERKKIAELSAEIHRLIEEITIPQEIDDAISSFLSQLGEKDAYAIRSSATAEDLPTAAFAGQQDTFLNCIGKQAILRHVSKCWASLFSERAITYRLQNGFDHRKVYLAVVVQKMVFAQAAGIMFTADPVTGNRKVAEIDASFGLGEAVVAGLVNADHYKVGEGRSIDKTISTKTLAVSALKDGGTHEETIAPELQNRQTLTDAQILQLERTGRKIEAHYGSPQDIEWCLVDDTFYIVQSRPITTLFPIPAANDSENHVYVSVGHQQMMTDAMRPLGISVWQLTAARPMFTAGGRLFVDISNELSSPVRRDFFVNVLGKSDPLLRDALQSLLKRGDFIKSAPVETQEASAAKSAPAAPPAHFQALTDYDPSVVAELIQRSQRSLAELKQAIQTKSGLEAVDFILEDIQKLKKSISDPQSFGVIMTAMNAASWINEKMLEWLGEKNAADTLSQSVPNNVTSEMGLALMDVADVIRPYPEVIDYLHHLQGDDFGAEMVRLHGGTQTKNAIDAYLDKYGMRCAGEIDITKTRWSEKPTILVPLILSNIKNLATNASKQRFEQGRQEALKKEEELLARLWQLADGEQKANETKRMIQLVRNLAGYREYPKYDIVSRYFVYKQALLKEAAALVHAGVIQDKEDIYYLTFEELRQVVASYEVDYQIIRQRKDEYSAYEKLTPPRLLTSDGEMIRGEYKREDLPTGAIAGLAVSSGTIEGRARVLVKMEDAELEEGDILVTTFTDPSWTPLFVCIKGLVTEVGGLMTHGAVIAREYGLPAVVGVQNATRRIKDGQRIRVNGTDGYIEILD